jgi:peptide/nickel transport system substrate-binding protein
MKAGFRPAALVVALALAACSTSASRPAGPGHNRWTTPGVFRFAVTSDPKSLNPAIYPLEPTLSIAMFVYSWAIQYDALARPIPDALREVPTVANGDVSRDGLTLKYKLRQGAKWQDGRPLTCEDLKFTWKVVLNPHNDIPGTQGYGDIAGIDCSDPEVALIHMKRLYAPFLQQLWSAAGSVPILPAHILARFNDDKGSFNRAAYNALPVGSGPYKVVAWERGQEIRLAANPYYYLGKPRLREVVFKILPQSAAAIGLRAHEVDMIAGSEMNWPQYVALAQDRRNGLDATLVEELEWTHVDFNLDRAIVGDRNVRVALAYATDRREIRDKLLHGVPFAADSDQDPHLSWAYADTIAGRPYDARKARAILDADGWKVGNDGIRAKRGQRMEFSLSACSENAGEAAIETLVQRQWREVGVEANIKNYPNSLFFDESAAGVLAGGRYDAAIQSSMSGPDPDHSDMYSGDRLAPRGQNTLRWRNAAATHALGAALRTVDQARRKRYYVIVQQQLERDAPTIVIGFIRKPLLYNSDLRGFMWSPVSGFSETWRYAI